jgi:sodium/hydrogen exchanger 8
MSPWICYLIADGLELSGIVAILINGIFLNQYAEPNVNAASRKVIHTVVNSIAYTTETTVFLFLGIGVFAFEHKYEEMGVGTFVLTIFNLNIARALNV